MTGLNRMELAMIALDDRCRRCRTDITCDYCEKYDRCDIVRSAMEEMVNGGEGFTPDEARRQFLDEHACASCRHFDCVAWGDCLDEEVCDE